MLEHRDIKGTVEFDQETKMFFGKLIGVNGLVMYEAENAEEFEKNFISAVDEYIQMCEENEMPIKKEYKGVFNVRTSPENHERLFTISEQRGIKLNAVINEAFDFYLTKYSNKIASEDLNIENIPTTGYIPTSQGSFVWKTKVIPEFIDEESMRQAMFYFGKTPSNVASYGSFNRSNRIAFKLAKDFIERKNPKHHGKKDEHKK